MPTINGTAGNDVLVDTPDDDALNGLGGLDTITVTRGRDVVDGGADDDRLVIDYSGLTVGIQNFGETGFDEASGTGTTSTRFTGVESFAVSTGSGNDTIRTFFRPDSMTDVVVSGNDTISLGDGADRAGGGAGNDTLRGGEGNDILDGDGSIRGKFGAGRNLGDQSFTGSDTLFGEGGDDLLQGGAGDDILDGGIGNDTLYGDGVTFSYNDTTNSGGGGTVSIVDQFGGMDSGNDVLNGGDGDDILEGRLGNDTVNGDAGDDVARFNVSRDGSDLTDLGTGNDTVEIGVNADSQRSSAIRLTFTSSEVGNGNANDGGTLANQDGGLGVRLQSEDYADGLFGDVSRFDDEGITFVAEGSALFDVRDLVSGAQRGNLFGEVQLGTSGADVMTADTGVAYYFNGGAGNDAITGGVNADFLVGGGGADMLDGGDGADTFIGGGGNDSFVGGAGVDTANYGVATAGATVRLNLATASDGSGGTDTLSGIENVTGSNFNDTLVGNGAGNVLNGGLGADTLVGLNGDDVLIGGSGAANQLQGGQGDDRYVVSANDTLVEFADEGVDLVQTTVEKYRLRDNFENLTSIGTSAFTGIGNALNNVLTGSTGVDTLIGQGGDDVLIGGSGAANQLQGGMGNDRYVVSANDTLVEFAGEGSDTVEISRDSYVLRANFENLTYTGSNAFTGGGNALDNVITGGAQADVLTGAQGNDTLNGGAGEDIAVLSGNRADYTFTATAGGFQSVDATAGRDGTDQLVGVERVRFADGSTAAVSSLVAPVPGAEMALADDAFLMSKDDGPQVLPGDDLFDFGGRMASDMEAPRSDSAMAFLLEDNVTFAPADRSPGGHDDWMM